MLFLQNLMQNLYLCNDQNRSICKMDSYHGVVEVKETKNPNLSFILKDLFLANRADLNRIQLYNE